MTEIKEAPNKVLRTRLAWVRAWLSVYGPVDETSFMGMIEAVLLADLAIVPSGAVATVQFPHNVPSVALFFLKRAESAQSITEPGVCHYVLGLEELAPDGTEVHGVARRGVRADASRQPARRSDHRRGTRSPNPR